MSKQNVWVPGTVTTGWSVAKAQSEPQADTTPNGKLPTPADRPLSENESSSSGRAETARSRDATAAATTPSNRAADQPDRHSTKHRDPSTLVRFRGELA